MEISVLEEVKPFANGGYVFTDIKNNCQFDFLSQGSKGAIRKRILFKSSKFEGFYNLAFGDINAESLELDTKMMIHNNDAQQIIDTVIRAIYIFTNEYPEIWIYAIGNTASRARLFRKIIQYRLNTVENDFDIYEDMQVSWPSKKITIDCAGFVIKRKSD